MKKKLNFKVLAVSLLVVYAAAFIGSLFTTEAVKSEWYSSVKPSITPPNYVFPIVWNILFFLIAISLFLTWANAKKKQKAEIAWYFGVNLGLNILWSLLYFGLRNPIASFIEIFFLIASTILIIIVCSKFSRASAILLMPYLLWLCFASFLNYLSI